jgi:hypothetical protein
MLPEDVQQLKRQYAGRSVVVDAQQPELARMAGRVGQIKNINFGGRALVQFDGVDQGWYDIGLGFLKVVEKPTVAAGEQAPEKTETR